MGSVGARLKKLRLEKGASLEDINKKTKIHPDILKSLEEDSLQGINPVYLKGFIRAYCQSLGAEPAEYLHAAEEPDQRPPQPKESPQPSRGERQRPVTRTWPAVPLKAVAIAAGVLASVLVLVVLFNLLKFASAKISAGRKRHKEQAAIETVKAAKKSGPPVRQKTKSSPAPQPQKTVSKAVSTPMGTVNTSIQAIEDCWVQAKVDGKTVFQNVLKRGRSESWSAKDRIELTVGSAGGIRLEVNGKLMPALGHKGQVLKNILITREGLKVPK